MKSLVYHVLNFKSRIKLIYDKIIYTYCVINEFNPTFVTQNMGNEAFENASFLKASFGNGNEDYSCLWADTRTPQLTLALILVAGLKESGGKGGSLDFF